MLLPRWFPFHVSKISYWARTVLVPLTVVMARRPEAQNPTGATIVFEVVVDDYAEVWVDGKLAPVLGQMGGAVAAATAFVRSGGTLV